MNEKINWYPVLPDGPAPTPFEDTAGGGGTITTAEVWTASGPPVHTPTIDRQIYLDITDGAQYNWFSGSWH